MQTNINRIFLRGRLAAPPVPSHVNHGVEYFTFPLAVRRLSGAEDRLNVVASQEQLAELSLEQGCPLAVLGEVRTFNNRSGVGSRLVVSVFARTGLMTQAARVTTPVTAARVNIRARGRRRGFHRFPLGRRASMARMGTLRIKAMAPPTRKGDRTPSTHRRAPARAGRFCRAQKKATPPQATASRCLI